MIKVNLSRAIKSELSIGIETGAKQFTALFMLLAIVLLAAAAKAQERCQSIFNYSIAVDPNTWAKQLDIKPNALSKYYYQVVHKYGKKPQNKITITLTDGSNMKVKIPENIRHQQDPMKNLNISTMGYLGKVFDLKFDPETKKPKSEINEYYYKEELEKARARLAIAPKEPSVEFVTLMKGLLHVEKAGDGFVTVKLDLARKESEIGDSLSEGLKERFTTTYLHLVNWSYRNSGLEKNKSLLNMTMMDEIGEILVKEYRAFTLNMIFDEKVWLQQLRVLETRVNEYKLATDEGKKIQILYDIREPNDPYFPLAGVSFTHHLLDPSQPMEIKRYFKNDHEDPMKLMNLQDKNEFIVRHKMIYKMIESMPRGQQLEIHAHTIVHVRAYLKLGFHKTEVIENPLYPGVQVQVLRATREEALAKIALILSEQK